MTTQQYLMIPTATSVVENVCVWNGDLNTWQLPTDALMLVQADTPAMVWQLNVDKTDYVLVEQIGLATIGFTWDGTVCTTNEAKPTPMSAAENQPITRGVTTI